ncbi:unnamed protein product, partial [Prorocentrum cordatum]
EGRRPAAAAAEDVPPAGGLPARGEARSEPRRGSAASLCSAPAALPGELRQGLLRAVVANDDHLARHLLDLRADPNAAAPLEASGAGDAAEVQRLLDQRADPSASLPLHLAVRTSEGSRSLVRTLLHARADVEGDSGRGALSLAIEKDIYYPVADLVSTLVAGGASLVDASGRKQTMLTTNSGRLFESPVDLLFSKNNAVTIAAAAEGLKEAPEQVRALSDRHLLSFLNCYGLGPVNMFEALFAPRTVRYWGPGPDSEPRYFEVDTAYVDISGFNVGEGPDSSRLEESS